MTQVHDGGSTLRFNVIQRLPMVMSATMTELDLTGGGCEGGRRASSSAIVFAHDFRGCRPCGSPTIGL